MAEARALLDSEQPDRPRSLVVTLVCPQPHKLMHGYGALQLAEHVREHFLRVTDLEIDLGISKQTLRLAPAQESCREDVEQGRLPTLQRQLVVPATARVLGFKYHEAVETATGFARVHNLCVLMEEEGKLYLEPLSGIYTDQLSQHLPGRVRWLPPSLEAVEKMDKEGLDVKKLPEVDGLQILRGSMDHIVDSRYKDPWKALSFSKMMWWVDLSLLTCALFYIDIVLDIKQLALFYGSGLHGYLLLNMMGMAMPIIFTTWDAIRFVGTRSADLDAMTVWIPPGILLPLLVIATISQTLMLLLALVSAATGKKQPLLSGAKFAEVAESATSALVQTNFLISALGGVSQIQALELSEEQLQSMQLSVAVSCLSLGLGFASRDKADSAVLGLPGKLGWDATMAVLVLTRSMEVSSRVFAYNILQVSVRGWPLLRFGSLVAVGLVLVSARLLFPDASLADVAASTIAHPGQILEPSSLLPLQHSLCLHGVLVAAAGGAQLLLHTSAAPDASKMLPSALLIAWLAVSIASWAALVLLRMRGTYVDQPRFVALASAGDRSIPFSTLAPAFGSSGQVPKAVFKAMKAKHVVKLDTKAAVQGLNESTLRLILDSGVGIQLGPIALEKSGLNLQGLFECFAALPQLKKADFREFFKENGKGAELLLGALARCRELQELNMGWCQKVPAAAWRLLGKAEWPALKKADFDRCFDDDGEGAEELLDALGRCRELEELNMAFCGKVPAAAWRLLGKAEWPALKKANFSRCFAGNGEEAAELLAALGRCRKLEAVDFRFCKKIPESAWAALEEGVWPVLRNADGIPETHLSRLRGGRLVTAGNAEVVARSQLSIYSKMATTVRIRDAELQGDLELFKALAQSRELEELNMSECLNVPAAAWRLLAAAEWPALKKANFALCFAGNGEEAAELLGALCRCRKLEELDMVLCGKVPAAAWRLLGKAEWPALKKADFRQCFKENGEGAEGLMGALGRCRELEELDMSGCEKVPAAAWRLLGKAEWPALKKANFEQCFKENGEGAEGLMGALGRCRELEELDMSGCGKVPAAAWRLLGKAEWPALKKANFELCFCENGEGAQELLGPLGRCRELEELDMLACQNVPAAAWRLLGKAEWPTLKKADFQLCFCENGEGAQELLGALGRCRELEDVDFRDCDKIPESAWAALGEGVWPHLRNEIGIPEAHLSRLRGQREG